jgi:hypothetical protein
MNAQVVTVCSRIPGPSEPYYRYATFIESLRRFAETPTVLGMNEEWRGLMTKPWRLREWLRAGNNTSDRLIVCDAFDIVFAQHPHGIGDRCAEYWGDATVFNGEKGCWPREDLKDAFAGDSPWRYLNSGFMCGPTDRILALLCEMDVESIGFDPPGGPYPNDQGEYQALYARQREHGIRMIVDGGCRVSQTLSACTLDEFDLTGKRIRNRVTGTEPGVFHFNGGSKNEIMPAMLEKLNL